MDGGALLILGPSRAGKSRLAHALIAAGGSNGSIVLVGDDRIILTETGETLIASPHPRIAGFIERRGLGIVACPFVAQAPVEAVVDLGTSTFRNQGLENFPRLAIVTSEVPLDIQEQANAVLAWWTLLLADATSAPHSGVKAGIVQARNRKD